MKLKPYPEYKDSGVQWIGEIPEGWNNYKLKHVVNEFVAGGTPRSDDEKFWAHDEHGIPWVNIGDMTNNEIVTETKKEITVEGQADKGLRILKKGTLLYSIFASLGKVAVLGIDATTNQAILGLIISKKIDTIFLKYYLKNLEEPIITLSNANTQNNLNSTIVKNIEIGIPSLSDQTTIANFLDKKTAEIDVLIEKDKKLIALLKEKRTALINHAVTKGLDPNVKLKDSGIPWIGEIPEGWEVRKLKFKATELKIKDTTKNPNTTFIGLEHIESWTGRLLFSTKLEFIDGEAIKFRKNNVLFGKLRPYLAKVLHTDFDGSCTGELLVYKTNNDVYSKYLFYRFLSISYIDLVNSMTYGVKMPRADPIQLANIKLPWSPPPEQIAIAEFLDNATSKIDKTIKKIEEKIKLLEEYKKSLIHYVVTGKVDVRGVVV